MAKTVLEAKADQFDVLVTSMPSSIENSDAAEEKAQKWQFATG